MPQIIIVYVKKAGTLMTSLLFFAGLMMLLPKLFTRQCVRYVCIVVLIAGIFYNNFSMSDTFAQVAGVKDYAAPKGQELEKTLDIDDSEVIPAIEEKIKETAKASELASLSEPTEEPTNTVSSERHSPGKDAIDHFNLGVNHQKQGYTLKAIEEYKYVLKSDPNNAEAHNNLGVIYKERNDLDKAVEHYQFVVTTNPEMDEAHNNLGVVYYLRGDHREAVQEYLKALELNPNNLMSHMNLGLIYNARGLKQKAIDTLEKVLSVQPFHTEANYNLAIIYEELGHLERAIWHYTRFVDNAGRGYPDLTERVTRHIKVLKVNSNEVVRKEGIGVFPSLRDNQAY